MSKSPKTPSVLFCHDWFPGREAPPRPLTLEEVEKLAIIDALWIESDSLTNPTQKAIVQLELTKQRYAAVEKEGRRIAQQRFEESQARHVAATNTAPACSQNQTGTSITFQLVPAAGSNLDDSQKTQTQRACSVFEAFILAINDFERGKLLNESDIETKGEEPQTFQ